MSPTKKKVLIVDDFESLRLTIKETLNGNFEIFEAENANIAYQICKIEDIDVVISDIKLPGENGLELVKNLRILKPNIKYIIITAYNIDDFIPTLRQENILIVLPKSIIIENNFILGMVQKILNHNPFGLRYYFPEVKYLEIKYTELMQRSHKIDQHHTNKNINENILLLNRFYVCKISNSEESNIYKSKIGQILIASGSNNNVLQVVEELIANALRYSPDGTPIEFGFGIFNECTVVGVVDYAGVLDPKQVLLYLERQTNFDSQSGLPLGLKDTHGRGLYICRESTNQLIINIEKNVKTEIIAILAHKSLQGTKSISIFQKD